MDNNQPFDITSDAEIETALRGLTDYDDERIDAATLHQLRDDAKRILALRADITRFYNDRGAAEALLGITCIKAKAHVENQPVRAESVSSLDTTFRTTDGSSLQVEQYEAMVEHGLSNSGTADDSTDDIYLTNTYYSDTRSG